MTIHGAAIRNSSKYFIFSGISVLLMLMLALHAASIRGKASTAETENAELARRLKLTDICLFTEARYTRHPAMADNHAAFQEHPSAFDHFPSGSLLMPLKDSRTDR